MAKAGNQLSGRLATAIDVPQDVADFPSKLHHNDGANDTEGKVNAVIDYVEVAAAVAKLIGGRILKNDVNVVANRKQ
jgi:hypothetical protein